jgi:hypothetical protein
MYFGSEHKDIIFLQIDGIDLQAHIKILSSSLLRELPVSLYIVITFIEIKILFKVWKFMKMARHIVLKCSFRFNLLNYLVVIKITFRKLVLFTPSGESRTETYPFGPLTEQILSLVQGSQQIVNILVRP